MKKIEFILIAAILLTTNLYAGTNIIPDNDLSIPPLRSKEFGEVVTEYDFNNVTKLLYKIYAPVIKAQSNITLVMSAVWNDDTVNAFATRELDTWTVHIAGGVARAKGMTKDSLALIVCHELGHHLGGAPRTYRFDGWPSAEGQADYWATSKCMKNYYAELAIEVVAIDQNVPQKVITDCNSIYKAFGELKICVRTMIASINFAHFLNALPDVKIPATIEVTDPREVKGTNTNDYPRPQCRLDTLYQGALCTVGSHVATSETDAKIGHCNDTTKPGTRPRCWYKP